MNKKDSKLLTDPELKYRIKTNKNANPKLLLEDIKELSRREDTKGRKNERMSFIILILTIIIVILTVWDIFFAHAFTPFFLKPTQTNISIDEKPQTNENSSTQNTVNN